MIPGQASVSVEAANREQRQAAVEQVARASQLGQVDDGGALHHRGAQAFQQLAAGHHGAAGGDQVVHQQHAVAGLAGIGMDFDRGAAIFELVLLDRKSVV